MDIQNKFIYITYLSNDRDYKGALLLNYNLKKYNHKYNLACIVLEGVSKKIRNILKKSNILLYEFNLKNILLNFNISENFSNYLVDKHYYGKFIIFKLIEYDKIVYLDTDLLIKENIDNLFKYDTKDKIYMTYDVLTSNTNLIFRKNDFNSGVIILEPSNNTYEKCYQNLNDFENNKDNLFTDQTILNLLNKNNHINVNYLDFKYNYISMLGNKTVIKDYPIIIHFILHPKPWQIIDMDDSILEMYVYSDGKKYFDEWINLYFDMVKEQINKMNKLDKYFNYNKIFLRDNEKCEEIEFL
jgi:lipopolysaccharide biosynthesis glycosyltransferase